MRESVHEQSMAFRPATIGSADVGHCPAKLIKTPLHRIRALGKIAVPLALCACSPSPGAPVAPPPDPGSGGSASGSAGQGGGAGGTTGLGGFGGSGGISIAVDSGTSGGGSSGCGRKNVTALFV